LSTVGSATLRQTGTRTVQGDLDGTGDDTTVVKISSGSHIQISFRGSRSNRVYFGASPGQTVPDRLHTTVAKCS